MKPAKVLKQIVPMYIGFDEDYVEMLCSYLEESIERGNVYLSLFGDYDE